MDFGMPFLMELDTVEDAARLCDELGLAFVELNANFPPCRTERLDAATLRVMKERYGIGFTLHVEEECDPFTFNPDVRRAWQDTLRASLRMSREAEMPIVNMHFPRGVYITLPTEKVFLYKRYREEFLASVRDLIVLAEEELNGSGVRLCIENTSGWQPHQREAIDLMLTSPVFGLTLDIGHSHGVSGADEDFFLARRSRLWHMHGHDARGKRCHLALGDGEIDLGDRFRLAKSCDARVVLETKTVAALTASVSRLYAYLES